MTGGDRDRKTPVRNLGGQGGVFTTQLEEELSPPWTGASRSPVRSPGPTRTGPVPSLHRCCGSAERRRSWKRSASPPPA